MELFGRARVVALGGIAAASLLAAALPASAATTTELYYIGTASDTSAIDMSGKGNVGTLHDVTATGEYYAFGAGARISLPASRSINPGTADYSYGVTMRLPASYVFTHDLSLVRRGASKLSGAYYKMELVYNRSTGITHLECAMRDQAGNTGYIARSSTGLNDGAWHTLTCTKTATTLSITKDGSTYSHAEEVGNLSTGRSLNIGAEHIDANTYWEHFPGDMDSIIITKG